MHKTDGQPMAEQQFQRYLLNLMNEFRGYSFTPIQGFMILNRVLQSIMPCIRSDEQTGLRELREALELMDSPASWFDSDMHCCRFCDADNEGVILHKPECEITKLRAAILKAKG
jgi:hypothetical protein